MNTVMLLLSEGGSDCIWCVATHLEEENGNYNSAGEVQSTENKMSLQGLLLLQKQDAKPTPQNQFTTDLLTFDLCADVPEIIVGIILIIKMKALQDICYLCPKFTILTNTAEGLFKDGKLARSRDNKAANQWRKNDNMGTWKCLRNFSI